MSVSFRTRTDGWAVRAVAGYFPDASSAAVLPDPGSSPDSAEASASGQTSAVPADTGAASVEALGGNVIVDACRFQSDGTPVHVGGSCDALVFTGNIVKGSKRIKSDIVTEIREQNNVWGLKAKKEKK